MTDLLDKCRNPGPDVVDYAADVPNAVAIANAERIIKQNPGLPPVSVICSGDGGVGLAWDLDTGNPTSEWLEVEVDNDGDIWVVKGGVLLKIVSGVQAPSVEAVKRLRDKTGGTWRVCKKALTEASGDEDAAYKCLMLPYG